MSRTFRAAGIAAAVLACGALAAPAGATIAYNSIEAPLHASYSSEAFQATQTSQFGGQVHFGPGLASHHATSVSVVLVSWACQNGVWNSASTNANACVTTPGATFTHPITLKINAVGAGNSVGALLASTTSTFTIPYRPSSVASCDAGAGDSGWRDATGCHHGLAHTITFDVSGLGVTLPADAIISVAYNTSGYGPAPLGYATACNATVQGCPYDSLNVAAETDGGPTVGSQPIPADAYLSSATAGQYCDGGAGGTGTFRLDAGCWGGYQPKLAVTVTSPTTLTFLPFATVGLNIALRAVLLDDTGAPAPGQAVTFTRGSYTCTATTDAGGIATCLVNAKLLGGNDYTATFPGSNLYLASAANSIGVQSGLGGLGKPGIVLALATPRPRGVPRLK